MADIEKVKQGLKQHHAGICTEKYGTICPYWECEASCSKELMVDALSVIEQMEQEIERLREIATLDCDICANKMLNDERRWIPVSERLPELYTTVLVAVYGKRVTYCQVWLFGKEKGWTLEGVTHWMPLPQPPKEGDRDG